MDQMVQQLVDQVFRGRETADKSEVTARANNLGLPAPVRERISQLPEGQLSKSQVERYLGDLGDLGGGLEDIRKAV